MENQNIDSSKISNTPMILGIIGGVIGIPGAFCAGACAACIGGASGRTDSSAMGNFYLIMALSGAVLGLVAAIKYKSNIHLWFKMFFVAAVLSGFTLIAFNVLALISAILFIIAGFLLINEKKKIPRNNLSADTNFNEEVEKNTNKTNNNPSIVDLTNTEKVKVYETINKTTSSSNKNATKKQLPNIDLKNFIKPAIIITSIGILSAVVYIIFHKSPVEKAISYIQNSEYKTAFTFCEEKINELNADKSENEEKYKEKNTLVKLRNLAENLMPVTEINTAHARRDKLSYKQINELNNNLRNLPYSLDSTLYGGLKTSQIENVTKSLSDTITFSFAELFLNPNAKDYPLNEEYLNYLTQYSNASLLMNNIKQSSVNQNRINSIVEKIKNLQGSSNAQNNNEQVQETVNTNTEEEDFAKDFIGEWTGNIGDKDLIIIIEKVDGSSRDLFNVVGYNSVKGNKRAVTGEFLADADAFTITLKEPGDDKWDGVFTLHMENDNKYNAIGNWKANNGKLTSKVSIQKNNNSSANSTNSSVGNIACEKSFFYELKNNSLIQRKAYLINGDAIKYSEDKSQPNYIYVYFIGKNDKIIEGWMKKECVNIN